MYQFAIIGGGASGLMAAITAAHNLSAAKKGSVIILERGERVGRKLLATGNGRCNLTNTNLSHDKYHGSSPYFHKAAFQRFSTEDTLRFFREIGLLCKTEDTRVYPITDTAASVLDCLRLELLRLGVKEQCGFEAVSIRKRGGSFEITSRDGTVAEAKKVVAATGGKAAKHFGSDGSGYGLLQTLGHSVTPLAPALVQIKTDPEQVRGLKGIRASGKITVLRDNHLIATASGELLFTDYGISGIPALEVSREVSDAVRGLSLSVDLLPSFTIDGLYDIIRSQRNIRKTVQAEQLLIGILHKRLGCTILKNSGVTKLSQQCGEICDHTLLTICRTLKDWRISLVGTMGWDQAQVTAGGIRCDEVNPLTMESRIVPGLYVIGELLDIDGDCGGYNLQWAWSSGHAIGGS